MSEPDEYVDLIVKYKDWIAIRRLGIRETTKPEEVSYHLAGIRESIGKRAYLLLGINTDMLDKYAENITSGMKKNYQSLTDALSKMNGSDAKSTIKSACTDPSYAPMAETYLLNKIIKNIGFDTFLNQLMMSKIFPNLKPPKMPMGRKPKK